MEVLLYELSCNDSSVPDKYIGYTTQYDDMIDRWNDPSVKQPQYMDFINDHGGIENWSITVFNKFKSRAEAETEKLLRIGLSNEYTLNKKTMSTSTHDPKKIFYIRAAKARASYG